MTGSRTHNIPLRNLETDTAHFHALSEITISRHLPENNTPICTPLLAMERPCVSSVTLRKKIKKKKKSYMTGSRTRDIPLRNLEITAVNWLKLAPPTQIASLSFYMINVHWQC